MHFLKNMDFWQLQKSCLKKKEIKRIIIIWVTFMPFYQLEKISLHVHTALIYICNFFALKKVIFKNFCFIIYEYVPKGFFHSYCYVYYTVGVSQMGHTVFLIPSSSPCFIGNPYILMLSLPSILDDPRIIYKVQVSFL